MEFVTRLELCKVVGMLREKVDDMQQIWVNCPPEQREVPFIKNLPIVAQEYQNLANRLERAVDGYSPVIEIVAGN